MGYALVALGGDFIVSADHCRRTYHVAVANVFAIKGRPHRECSSQLCYPRTLSVANVVS